MNDKSVTLIRQMLNGATRKGYLMKKGGSTKGWKKRWFVLKGNEMFYFDTPQETKLLGRFSIESDCVIEEEVEQKPKKDSFVFLLNGRSFKRARYFSAEADDKRKDWMKAIEMVVAQYKAGTFQCIKEGWLFKQGPKRLNWQKRYCVLNADSFVYYRQQKDLIPAGIIPILDCRDVVPDETKPNGFFIQTPPRRYFFYSESKTEKLNWMESLQVCIGGQPHNLNGLRKFTSTSFLNSREVFLSKPIKEGILIKHKKRDHMRKTKPVRLVLTHNFLYYFPISNSTLKYHSIPLGDVQIEPIPESIGKSPFSFRIQNLCHPLYLAAEDEKQYNTWINIFEQVIQNMHAEVASKTDAADVKTSKDIEYYTQIINERTQQATQISESKVFDVKVNAFWTSWVLHKTYEDFLQVFLQLLSQYQSFIFPEFPEVPLYTEGCEGLERSRKSSLSKVKRQGIIPAPLVPKSYDRQFDFKFLQCLTREILRNPELAQCQVLRTFFKLNNIFYAVEVKEIAFVRYFLEQKAELNILNDTGETSPLHYGAEHYNNLIMDALIEAGANPNLPNKRGQTPLYRAAEVGNWEAIVLLIERGALVNVQDETETTALHVAAINGHVSATKALLDREASIDVCDKGLRTPLHYAVIEGKKAVAEVLVARGSNIEAPDEEGFTPLLTACWKTRVELVEFLLNSQADVSAVDNNGRSAVHLAVLRKSEAILEILSKFNAALDTINGSGMAPLHIATRQGYESIVELLISKGASLSIQDQNMHQTPLHVAASSGKVKVAEILLNSVENSEELDFQDSEGKTPLHLAVAADARAIVALLLTRGASVDKKDIGGETALHIAARANKEMVHLLLEHRASINLHSINGSTPLHVAVSKSVDDVVIELLAQKADVTALDSCGNTPLHLALINKNVKIATCLCGSGASLSVMNNEGNPPLHYVHQKFHSQLQEAAATGVKNF
eukprot:TRINITY_DN5080_c0_g1_i1.p1 TRINITY_DN5080_c0_g1~~TRINITY_DN5080_c0_g1_i1.p1  ORF type:complete len:956 (-),score=247.96 TRINITY_DN5080_c0_g1_i1:60-2927(-)